jgi:hypothetical protein
MKRPLIRFFLIASIAIAALMVLGGIFNHKTPVGFWLGIAWLVGVMIFNVWIGAQQS